jgi:hypothetical protein
MKQLVCKQCGKPRSKDSKTLCRKCYMDNAHKAREVESLLKDFKKQRKTTMESSSFVSPLIVIAKKIK